MSTLGGAGGVGPQFHPGHPHVRVAPRGIPPDETGRETVPYQSDLDNWLRSGQWEGVASSDVRAIAYDAERHMLKFRFKDGSEHGYFPYSRGEARILYLTGSKGGFLWDWCLVRGRGNRGRTQRGHVAL